MTGDWKALHPPKELAGKRYLNLLYQPGNKPEDLCTVPNDKFAKGFLV